MANQYHMQWHDNQNYRILDAFHQGIVILDEFKHIAFCNQWFLSLFNIHSQIPQRAELHWLSQLLCANGGINGQSDPATAENLLLNCLLDADTHLEIRCRKTIYEIRSCQLATSEYALTFVDITSAFEQIHSLDQIIEQTPVAIIGLEASGRITMVNSRARKLLLAGKHRLIHSSFFQHISVNDRQKFRALFQYITESAAKNPRAQSLELSMVSVSGDSFPVELSLGLVETGHQSSFILTFTDLTQRKKAEKLIHQAHALTESIVNSAPFGIVATDSEGLILAASPAIETLLGYAREELLNCKNVLMFHDESELKEQAEQLNNEFQEDLKPDFFMLSYRSRSGDTDEKDCLYVRKDGSTLPVHLTITRMLDDQQELTGYLFVAYDITEQKRAQEYIQHMAHHDSLTGLPNRMFMEDRLEHALRQAKRHGNRIGVLVIDLDHFKHINDTLGHLAGDQVLKQIARRLEGAVRESDTVCRLGGDEFVVLLPEVNRQEDVELVCEKIISELEPPLDIGSANLAITPSIGLSIAPDDGQTSVELLKHADIAMYHAKNTGRNGYKVFHTDLEVSRLRDISIEQALHDAFNQDKLDLHYQPRIDLQKKKVVAVEALLRWHQDDETYSPNQFIPMAEATGFIVKLGEWVLAKACQEIQRLNHELRSDIQVAVNISPKQFEQPHFVEHIEHVLMETGLAAHMLQLELSEQILVSESEIAQKKLQQLSQLGIDLAVNDFATGTSNLGMIAHFPINIIKIDRRFMKLEQRANLAVINAIIAITQGLDLQLIFEGVEDDHQLEFINEKGGSLVQGFMFSKALPLNKLQQTMQRINNRVQKMLANQNRDPSIFPG